MKLEAEGQRAIVDPRSSDIGSAVSLLATPARKFVILSRSGTSYVQAMIVGANRHVLEYRDGGEQYRSVREDYSTGEVVGILEAYGRGEDSWRTENEWRRIEITARRDIWDRLNRILLVAGLVLVLDSVAARAPGGDPLLGLNLPEVLALAFALLMVSAIIDLRRFRTMVASGKARTIGMLFLGVLVVTIYWIERLTGR